MTISVCIHLVLIFLLLVLVPKAPALSQEPPSQTVTVTLMPPVPQPRTPNLSPDNKYARPFVDTADLIPANKLDPNALFEGDANTRAASKNPGDGNSALPSQTGLNQDELQIHNSTYSPNRPGNPTPPPPTPEQKPQAPTPPEKPAPQQTAQKKPQPSPDDIALKPGSLLTQNPKIDESTAPTPDDTSTQNPSQPSTSPRSPPSPPPSAFSVDRRRTELHGSAPMGDDSSVATQESEMGRYKAKLYRAVGSRWYFHVQQFMSTLSVERIRIRFYIRSDGRIKKVEVIEGSPQSSLAGISIQSIKEIDGQLEPFPESMKQQLGDGYSEEISFSVY